MLAPLPSDAVGRDAPDAVAALGLARHHFFQFYKAAANWPSDIEVAFGPAGEDLRLHVHGAKVSSRVVGAGPLVVFVHGLYGRASQFRDIVAAVTSAGYRAALFDVPGNGSSAAPAVHADFAVAVLKQLEQRLGRAHALVGHSMGCDWMLRAVERGFRAERLAILSGPASAELLLNQYIVRHALAPAVAEQLRRLQLLFDGARAHPAELLRAAHLPTLIAHGLADSMIPADNAQALARACSWARTLLLKHVDHLEILQATEVATAVVELLAHEPVD